MGKIDIYNTNRRYGIIYADPPWTFRTYSDKGKGRSAEKHYSCMNLKEIKELPVPEICEDDCVLFLWVTWPTLEEGLELIKAWGFTYKTCAFSWVKRCKKSDGWHWGMGYWTRANSEVCLLATRGAPKRLSRSVHQIVDARVREHSRKPDEVRDRIVQLCGEVPRIELFARQSVDGWDRWGDEA